MKPPTLGELAASCRHNASFEAGQLQRFRDRVVALGHDAHAHVEYPMLMTELSRLQSNYNHWKNYEAYYLERAAKEGDDAPAAIAGWMKPTLIAVPKEPEPPPLLPRELPPLEPLDDDDVPF